MGWRDSVSLSTGSDSAGAAAASTKGRRGRQTRAAFGQPNPHGGPGGQSPRPGQQEERARLGPGLPRRGRLWLPKPGNTNAETDRARTGLGQRPCNRPGGEAHSASKLHAEMLGSRWEGPGPAPPPSALRGWTGTQWRRESESSEGADFAPGTIISTVSPKFPLLSSPVLRQPPGSA